MPRLIIAASALVLAISAPAAAAATLQLSNGDRITATIVSMQDGVLKLQSPLLGDIEVAWNKVEAIDSERPLLFVRDDGTSVRGVVSTDERGWLDLAGDDETAPVRLPLENVRAVNPPPEERRLTTRGHVNAGLTMASGNSNLTELHFDGELVARTPRNRYTVGLAIERAEDNDETTLAKNTAYARYDRFFNGPWFLNNALTLQTNQLQDLDLRTIVGSGIGYQWFDTDHLGLSATAGLSYVREAFEATPNDETIAARIGVNYEHDWLHWLRFVHDSEALLGLEDIDDLVVRSRTGLRFRINDHLSSNMQVNIDYDRSPPPGTENEDITYTLGLGYAWE